MYWYILNLRFSGSVWWLLINVHSGILGFLFINAITQQTFNSKNIWKKKHLVDINIIFIYVNHIKPTRIFLERWHIESALPHYTNTLFHP